MKNSLLQSAVRQLSSRMGNLPPPCYPCRKETGKSYSFTFLGIIHSGKLGKCTDAAGVRLGIKSAGHYGFCKGKWRCFRIGNPNLIPYETIVRATSGEPEAVDEVLRHYSQRIRIAAIESGHVNPDTEDSIKSRLVAALFKFRFDEQQTYVTHHCNTYKRICAASSASCILSKSLIE